LPLADADEKAPVHTLNDESIPVRSRRGERILIVDDESPVRNVLSLSLEHLGYEVEISSSGMEALERYEKNSERFDLVILDMLMPNLSGEEVFFLLKEIDPDLRALIISGYSSEEAVQHILDQGGRGFIQKPFTISELSRKVRLCLT
jgi:CheY-like chemotaxis protein